MKQGGVAAEDETWVELALTVFATHSMNRFADGLGIGPDFRTGGEPSTPYLSPVVESHASQAVQRVYRDIKAFYELERVPGVYQVMARNPAYLADMWTFNKLVFQPGRLSRRDKEFIALAVSAAAYSPYGIDFHLREVRRLGADDRAIYEVMAIVHHFSGLTAFAECLQLEPDMLPRQL